VPNVCTRQHRARTGGDGGFGFELAGREVRGLFGETRRLVVAADGRDGPGPGPVTSAAVEANSTDIALGDLRLWGARVALGERDSTVTATWVPPPPSFGSAGRATLSFEAAGGTLWAQPTGAGGGGVDGRVLEDTAGSAVATVEARSATGELDIELTYRTAGTPYLSGAGPPPSRGAACEGPPGTVRPGCPLTDGDLTTPSGMAGPLTVRFERSLPVRLVVVRGCAGPCAVEALDTAGRSVPLGSVAGPFATVAPGAAVTASALRVTGATAGLSEVSVWDGPGGHPLLRRVGEGAVTAAGDRGTQGERAADGGGGGADRGGRVWAALAVLAAVGLGAAGFALGRRSGGARR
jgi:hypothetical protein